MSQAEWGQRDGRALSTGEKLALSARQEAEIARSRITIFLVEAKTHHDCAEALHSQARLLAAAAEDLQENGDPDNAVTFRERSLAAAEEANRSDELALALKNDALAAQDAMFAAIALAEQLSLPSDAVPAQKPSRLDQSQVAGVAKAIRALEFLGTMVPKRISTEEIGDALERIHRLVSEKRPRWFIYLAVARACVAVLWHTLRDGAEQLVGIVKIATGQGHDRR